jgi:hypothetical protein
MRRHDIAVANVKPHVVASVGRIGAAVADTVGRQRRDDD